MSPTGGPGAPQELTPPGTRALQGYRGVWFALLVEVPRHLRNVQTIRRGLRALNR